MDIVRHKYLNSTYTLLEEFVYITEDLVKFLILRIFQQLKIFREAQASHGDVKPKNIMMTVAYSLYA